MAATPLDWLYESSILYAGARPCTVATGPSNGVLSFAPSRRNFCGSLIAEPRGPYGDRLYTYDEIRAATSPERPWGVPGPNWYYARAPIVGAPCHAPEPVVPLPPRPPAPPTGMALLVNTGF